MPPSAPRAILFDLDGTLVDTMFAFADLAAGVIERTYGAGFEWARSRYLETSGIPFAHQLEVLFPGHAENTAASEEFEGRKRDITRATPMEQRTREALEELRELGFKIAVSSNTGQDFVDEFARGEPFDFDLALGYDADTGLAKGEPHIARALEVFEESRGSLLCVGDSLKDAELARRSRVGFIARLGTFDAPAFFRHDPEILTVAHPEELPDLLGGMLEAA